MKLRLTIGALALLICAAFLSAGCRGQAGGNVSPPRVAVAKPAADGIFDKIWEVESVDSTSYGKVGITNYYIYADSAGKLYEAVKDTVGNLRYPNEGERFFGFVDVKDGYLYTPNGKSSYEVKDRVLIVHLNKGGLKIVDVKAKKADTRGTPSKDMIKSCLPR
ncbi:hypothetical protein [Treponema pedis]|uniref:hypothetical protein n=1 Tax=Treponema pedis TaxID=409322 RepID=UPI00197D6E6C|nr:hypothetical protein [Treponema pedis]QSI05723.1 hypothetical protein DYQ05_12825 [Treponema pedis]